MAHKITLIPGDGIGPEVTGAAVRILEATGVKLRRFAGVSEPWRAGARSRNPERSEGSL